MANGNMRPWGWTSTDAAGLSVFAGLVRYDEAASGHIKHAIRFTMQQQRTMPTADTSWSRPLMPRALFMARQCGRDADTIDFDL